VGLLAQPECREIHSEVAPFLELQVPRESVVTPACLVPLGDLGSELEEVALLDHLVFLVDLVQRVSLAFLVDLGAQVGMVVLVSKVHLVHHLVAVLAFLE